MSTHKRVGPAKEHAKILKGKSRTFREGFLDALDGNEDEKLLGSADYERGRIAAVETQRKNREKAFVTGRLKNLPQGCKALPRHTKYLWVLKHSRKDSEVLPISDLTEIDAKTALCDCLDVIAKLRDSSHKTYMLAENFLS